MGHQRIAGLVSEVSVAGKGMLRVDVPGETGDILFSRFYSPEAVYCISPTDKQIAIGLATKCASRPVNIYDLANLREDKRIGQGEETYDEDEV